MQCLVQMKLYPSWINIFNFQDSFQSSWLKEMHHNILNLGLFPLTVLEMGLDHAKVTVMQRLLDIGWQSDLN